MEETLERAVARIGRQLRTSMRKMEARMYRAFRRHACASKKKAVGAGVPTRGDGTYPLHLRLVYDTGDAYVACLVNDMYDGEWHLLLEKPLVPSVRVRKTAAVAAMVAQAALTAADVVRVHAAVDAGAQRVHKRRSPAGLFTLRRDEVGTFRVPKKKAAPLHVTFRELEFVVTSHADMPAVFLLAQTMQPPPNGVVADAAAYARTVGVLLPHNETTAAACLEAMGAPDLPWALAAVASGEVARLASDPRYAPLVARERSAATNAAVRIALDAARQWVPDAVVLEPRAKADAAMDDVTLPFLLKPVPAQPPELRPAEWRLTAPRTPTGVYASVTLDYASRRPRAFVRGPSAPGEVSTVVGYAYEFQFYTGDAKIPAAERGVQYQWTPSNMSVADTFVTRLETAAFDGDAAWSDAALRHALGLARRAVWVFRDPGGAPATSLLARAKTLGRL